MPRFFFALALAALAACGDESNRGSDTSASGAVGSGGGSSPASSSVGAGGTSQSVVGSGGSGALGAGGSVGCHGEPAPADHVRKVVVSHPYAADGSPASSYEVLELSTDGTLSLTGATFELGRSVGGQMAFTPDGAIGIVPDEDGDVGVVRFDEAGPTVVVAKLEGSFYAGAVVVEPSGDSALVLDPNWRENGGGIYRVRIACDGTLTDEGLIAPAKLPRALAVLASGRAVLAAADVLGSPPGHDAHLVDIATSVELVAGVDAFGDDEAIVSGAAATDDEQYVLISENSAFRSGPNRVAAVRVGRSELAATQVLSPFDDPVGVATSPFGGSALVLSGFGDAIIELGYDPANEAAPFEVRGELDYSGAPPELPGTVHTIGVGGLRGRALVTEVTAIRQVQFAMGGSVTDLGTFSFGAGSDRIVGSLGVQP